MLRVCVFWWWGKDERRQKFGCSGHSYRRDSPTLPPTYIPSYLPTYLQQFSYFKAFDKMHVGLSFRLTASRMRGINFHLSFSIFCGSSKICLRIVYISSDSSCNLSSWAWQSEFQFICLIASPCLLLENEDGEREIECHHPTIITSSYRHDIP